MITYDEAYAIASELKKNIEYCIEYDDAYRFGNHNPTLAIGGAGRSSVVVLKKNGKAIPMNYYVLTGGSSKFIREFEIK